MGLTALVSISTLLLIKAALCPSLVLAEWRHPVRAHFFNMPHMSMLILAIGMPPDIEDKSAQSVLWVIGAVSQTLITNAIYSRWLFDPDSSVGHDHARAPFLLSTVGWLLLTLLGQLADVDDAFGLNLPAFTFGIGVFMYLLVIFQLFQSMGVRHRTLSCHA